MAVVEKEVIKKIEKEKSSFPSHTIIVSFNNRNRVVISVPEILRFGVISLTIEYVKRSLVKRSVTFLGLKCICSKRKYFLIIILVEFEKDKAFNQAKEIVEICEKQVSQQNYIITIL